jgi:hypothetical protein
MNEPVQLLTTKPDKELAEEFRQKLVEAYKPVCDLFDQAMAAGFLVNVNLGPNAFGKHTIQSFLIAKKLVPSP